MSSNQPKAKQVKTANKTTSKAPSRNTHETLKREFIKQSKAINFDRPEFEFKLNYNEEEIDIIYRYKTRNDIEILIKKSDNETNCVVITYDTNTNKAHLVSLLNNVPTDDKCITNSSGTYYLDLIFNVIKMLMTRPQLNFRPNIFELIDVATKKMFFNRETNMPLSAYKLLTEGRTFYEGYGFIPYFLQIPEDLNIAIFEELINLRKLILEHPLSGLINFLTENQSKKLAKRITDAILEIITNTIELGINVDLSLSEIFQQGILILETWNSSELGDTEIDKSKYESLCSDVMFFIDVNLDNILQRKLKLEKLYYYSYIISSDMSYYTKISEIYAKYGIQRYKDYAEYLYYAITPKLSQNKYKTLKLGYNKRQDTNVFSGEDVSFKITFDEEDLNVIYDSSSTYSEIFIRRPGYTTNCVTMSYDKETNIVNLTSLLYKVAAGDKCRMNKLGSYYIDIMFMVIKLLQTHENTTFNPCLIVLGDDAQKQFFHFALDKTKLSIYKLLVDGRTFYEGYGFLPVDTIECSTINYENLDKLISIRHKLLNLPINTLSSYIHSELKIDKQLIFEMITKITKLVIGHEIINVELSLSEIFKIIVKIKKPNRMEIDLCSEIYYFVCDVLPGIFYNLELTENHNNYSYIITADSHHYSRVAGIYAKYGIKRYDEYANYLQIKSEE